MPNRITESLGELGRWMDIGLAAAIDRSRPGELTRGIERDTCDTILARYPDLKIEVAILHGNQLDTAIGAAGESALSDGDLVQILIQGGKGPSILKACRTTCIGQPSPAQQDFLTHLAEAALWFEASLLPGDRRPFVLTETRARTLSVRAGILHAAPDSEPLFALGEPVALTEGMQLWVETSLSSREFGVGRVINPVRIGPKGVVPLIAFPLLPHPAHRGGPHDCE